MKGDVLQSPVTDMDANTNDQGSEHNDNNTPKEDFVSKNNHKYCT